MAGGSCLLPKSPPCSIPASVGICLLQVLVGVWTLLISGADNFCLWSHAFRIIVIAFGFGCELLFEFFHPGLQIAVDHPHNRIAELCDGACFPRCDSFFTNVVQRLS